MEREEKKLIKDQSQVILGDKMIKLFIWSLNDKTISKIITDKNS